ncbi:MAG: hypothetical protein VXX85_00340, partial [Candidatus Margulisiibacteriota bacterium]|nr:hypothetical protein [Candidatus Margulisiibacteriota bacterium]
MNLKDINRKLGGMLMSVWQPQLDFNAIKEADTTTGLSNFLTELKAHNQRGDIMFASHYDFDEQLDDLLNVCLVEKGKADHVQQILEIKDELCKMAMNMDEVHTFDPNHKFNIMEGEETFKDFERIQLTQKVITTIHKSFVNSKDVDIKTDQAKAYEAFLTEGESAREIFAAELKLPPGQSLPAGNPKDWDFSKDPFTSPDIQNKARFIHHLLYKLGPSVYGMQHNLHYGFRDGTPEAVPYTANNQASVGENFTDSELVQWLTFNAQHIEHKGEGIKKASITPALLERIFMYGNSQFDKIKTLKSQDIKAIFDFLDQFAEGKSRVERLKAFNVLASADASTNADRAEFERLINQLSSEDAQECLFYMMGNTAVKTELYESNPSQALMHDLLEGDVFGTSGTLETAGISSAWFSGDDSMLHTKIDGKSFDHFYDEIFQTNNGTKSITKVDSSEDTIQEFVAAAKSGKQLLVDAGALIQGQTNRQVAETLATEVSGNWVVYYDESKKELAAIKKDEGRFSEKSYEALKADVKGNPSLKDNIIVYFDDARKTGTDVKDVTVDKPKMLLTMSKNNTTMDVQQAIGRDRKRNYDFDVVVRRSEYSNDISNIRDIYRSIIKETNIKRNQTRFTMVMMDAKAVVVEDVRVALKELSRKGLKDLLQNKNFKDLYKSLVSTTIATGLDEFSQSDQTSLSLKDYLDQKKQELLELAKQINELLPDDAAKNTMQLPLQSSAKRFDLFNKIFSQVNLTGNSKVSDLQATEAPSISQSQVQNQEQSEDRDQIQSRQQSQVSQMQQATEQNMQLNRTETYTIGENLSVTRIIPKAVEKVDSAPKFSAQNTKKELIRKDLAQYNHNFAQRLYELNMLETIKFSERWLSNFQSSSDTIPRIHCLVEKNGVYHVMTSAELDFFKGKLSGDLKDGTVIFDDVLKPTYEHLKNLPKVTPENIKTKAALMSFQLLVSNPNIHPKTKETLITEQMALSNKIIEDIKSKFINENS